MTDSSHKSQAVPSFKETQRRLLSQGILPGIGAACSCADCDPVCHSLSRIQFHSAQTKLKCKNYDFEWQSKGRFESDAFKTLKARMCPYHSSHSMIEACSKASQKEPPISSLHKRICQRVSIYILNLRHTTTSLPENQNPELEWRKCTCHWAALSRPSELCRLFLLKRLVANLKFREGFRRASAIRAAASANACSNKLLPRASAVPCFEYFLQYCFREHSASFREACGNRIC